MKIVILDENVKVCYLQETHPKHKNTERFKATGLGKLCYINTKPKTVGTASILILGKKDFKRE